MGTSLSPVEWLEARFDREVKWRIPTRQLFELVDDLSAMHVGHDRARWPEPFVTDDLDELERRARSERDRIAVVAALRSDIRKATEVPEVGYLSRAFDTIVETP